MGRPAGPEEEALLRDTAGRYPTGPVLARYADVPAVHRNRLHYPLLAALPETSALVFVQTVLQRFSGSCTVAELAEFLVQNQPSTPDVAATQAAVCHLGVVLHRDLWLKFLLLDLGACSGVIGLTQDSVDAVSLSFPLKLPPPVRSVWKAEMVWRSALMRSNESPLDKKAPWLHWEVVRCRYDDWWLRQIAAGDGGVEPPESVVGLKLRANRVKPRPADEGSPA
ncbi:hypothetical protein DIPPA_19290 [Diplonema papillatum]|nr:hypothetical protein DIPPA_19290 [Diplonema papillatum]|eukprot:gene20701-31901_t